MCLSKGGSLPYNVTDQQKSRNLDQQNTCLVSLYLLFRTDFVGCEFSGKEGWCNILPRHRGQRQREILPSALRFVRES